MKKKGFVEPRATKEVIHVGIHQSIFDIDERSCPDNPCTRLSSAIYPDTVCTQFGISWMALSQRIFQYHPENDFSKGGDSSRELLGEANIECRRFSCGGCSC